jgi:hypothetical protein
MAEKGMKINWACERALRTIKGIERFFIVDLTQPTTLVGNNRPCAGVRGPQNRVISSNLKSR